MIIHLTASRRRALSFSAQLSRPKQGVVSVLPGIGKEEVTLLLEGTLDSGKPGREGMKYRVAMRLISKGGKQNISAERGITLTQGREAWLVLSATTSYAASGTDFSGNRYKEVCDSLLNAATQHVQIKESHIASHRTFYDRVSLTLPFTEDDVLPTNERITRFTERESPAFGRSLLQLWSFYNSSAAPIQVAFLLMQQGLLTGGVFIPRVIARYRQMQWS